MFFPSRNIFFMLKFFPLLAYKMSLISYFVMELFFIFLLKYKVIFFIFFFIHLNVLRFCIPFLTCNFFFFSKRCFFSLPPRKHVLSSTLLSISIIPRLLCNAEMSSFLAKKLFIEEFFHFIFPSSILGPVHLSN